jgi:ABC-type nitrate/sulfonate/bicarbonate transport system ATPase subunit
VSVISARHVTKRFGDLAVLADVSLAIARRDVVGLLGPSGCGKTTLLRILLGLETYDSGELSAPLHRAGYLPQDALLLPWKTVLGNAELPLQLQGVPAAERRRRVREALPDFGLEDFASLYPHEMSGGMRQRAALLRAVLTGSEVLVLDEPFGALDTLTRHRLQDWLADLTERLDRTVLFVTHDLEEAVVLSHRVIALSARPAVVLGEELVDLTLAARRERLGREFLAARDRLLTLLERVSA